VVSVVEDDGAKDEAHDEERERLKAIEVAQVVPPGEKEKIDYSSARVEGSKVGWGECLSLGLTKNPSSCARWTAHIGIDRIAEAVPTCCFHIGIAENDCAGG
jgi:hypothetical protein